MHAACHWRRTLRFERFQLSKGGQGPWAGRAGPDRDRRLRALPGNVRVDSDPGSQGPEEMHWPVTRARRLAVGMRVSSQIFLNLAAATTRTRRITLIASVRFE